MKIKRIIIFLFVFIVIHNITFAGGLLEQQYINSINNGQIELWFTESPGWNQSSWGRWKYCNASDTIREIYGDPFVRKLAIGWCKIDGDWYYFDITNNIMVSNSIIDGFQLGIDGKMINNGIEPIGMNYDTDYSYLKVMK